MNTNNLMKNLKILMEYHYLNGHELTRQTGIPQQTLQRLIAGHTDDPKLSTLLPIAKKFGISLGQLVGEEPLPTIYQPLVLEQNNPVPVITLSDAITWKFSIKEIYPNHWPYWINSDIPVGEFAFAVKTKLLKNNYSLIIIDPIENIQEGDQVLVILTNFHNPVIRVVHVKDKRKYLEKDGILQRLDINQHRIIGKVVSIQKSNSGPMFLEKKTHLFIGAVSDGQKTELHIEDEQGHLLGIGVAGTANLVHSVDSAWRAINTAFEKALTTAKIKVNDPEYCFHAALGLKSTEMEERLEEFKHTKHLFDTLLADSDGYFACIGAHGFQNGAIIIADEGTCAYQMINEECTKIGGWGFPYRDEGGAGWIGCEAVRKMFWWKDGLIESSPLLETILLHFSNQILQELSWAAEAKYAKLAEVVVQYAKQNDPQAVLILKSAASYIDQLNDILETRARNEKLPTCVIGNMSESLIPYLSKKFQQKLINPKYDAVTGAIKLLRLNFS